MFYNIRVVRDGPLENLWGAGTEEIQKKYACKGKLNEKKSLRLENSPPPHKFCNGPSLKSTIAISIMSRSDMTNCLPARGQGMETFKKPSM